MGKRLTRAEIDSFHEHGFHPGIDVFGEEECDAFRSRVEAFEQARPEAVAWAFDIKTNLLFDWVYDLSRAPRLLDAVEDLIGPDVLLTNSIFRIKEPGSTTYYGWHQDAARIRVEPGSCSPSSPSATRRRRTAACASFPGRSARSGRSAS